jgi:hypothetical protein
MLVERLGTEVDLVFIAVIAEKERLAAVEDKDEGIVGKRHQGLLLEDGSPQSNASPDALVPPYASSPDDERGRTFRGNVLAQRGLR